MRQQTAIVCALLVAAVSIVGAASYTQATVDRNANINVQSDDTALVGLEVGGGITYDSVTTTTDGELLLNLDDGTGVNGNSTFYYGADDSSTTRDRSNSAFNVTNNDGDLRDFTLSYTDLSDTNQNVKFDVYTYDATNGLVSQGTVDEEGTSVSHADLGAGKKLYVYVTVDTTAGDLGSGDDLSGTFTVTAS